MDVDVDVYQKLKVVLRYASIPVARVSTYDVVHWRIFCIKRSNVRGRFSDGA